MKEIICFILGVIFCNLALAIDYEFGGFIGESLRNGINILWINTITFLIFGIVSLLIIKMILKLENV